jgi:hypothetical protein
MSSSHPHDAEASSNSVYSDAAIGAIELVCLHLYSVPAGFAVSKSRRCRSRAWLESASALTNGDVSLSYCCAWSFFPLTVILYSDCKRADVRSEGQHNESSAVAAAAELAASLSAKLSARPLYAEARAAYVEAFTLITREVLSAAEALWGSEESGVVKVAKARAAADAPVGSISTAPSVRLFAHRLSAATAFSRVLLRPGALDGLGAMLTLLVAACHSPRAPIVCRPAPPWLSRASGNVSGATGTGALDAPADDVDTAQLDAALRGIPRVRFLAKKLAQLGPDAFAAWLARALPADALFFLFWIVRLAPARLEASSAPLLSGAAASYHVVRSDGGDTSPSCKLWDARAAAEHGTLRGLYHGTATENAFCMISFGPRVLSGTRHESSGALYGAGVYLTGDSGVALSFAERRGEGWAGWSLSDRREQNSDSNDGGDDDATPPNPHLVTSMAGGARARVVFELEAVAGPANSYIVGGRTVAVAPGSHPPPGAYIIAPDAERVVITKVHFFDADAASEAPRAVEKDKVGGWGRPFWAISVGVALLACIWWCLFT